MPNWIDFEVISSCAHGISLDRKFVVGGKTLRFSCIWTLQLDGITYAIELLPFQGKDYMGRVSQAAGTLRRSAGGDIIAGRYIDKIDMNMGISNA